MATHFQFIVAVTPGPETVFSGFCTLTVEVRSKHGNITDLNLENLIAIPWT
jgi:hypothetical protein